MRFLVLGAGALGGFFGGKLLKGGADVTFLVRPGRAAQLQRDGLVVKSQEWEIRTPVKTIQQGQVDAPFDVILLSCKAYDLDSAMAAIAPAVGPQSAILPMLNGMRHVDLLKERFGATKVLGGLVAVNTVLMPDGTIQQSPMRINLPNFPFGELDGSRSARCEAIKRALVAGDITTDISDNILAAMWMKFYLIGCAVTIASLTRSRAAAIAQSAAGPAFVAAVIDECTRIMTAEGYPPPAEAPNTVRSLSLQPGSTYGPSLLIDMEQGRTTEGEHIVGDLVARAARKGVSAPILTAALCNLQAYEINRSA
jgi:2-dehydropantoate 2-reductase